MITRLEIDGFKTFKDFAADFGPLNVIAGANGSGKSNLFDAIRWLSEVAVAQNRRVPVGKLVNNIRGAGDQSFTILPNQQLVPRIRMAVELFLDRTVKDLDNVEYTLDYTRFRYELEVTRRENSGKSPTFYISHELLTPIAPENDSWIKNHNLTIENGWLREFPDYLREKKLIYSTPQADDTIVLHLAKENVYQSTSASLPEIPMLARVNDAQSVFALAVQQELVKWSFVDISPTLLRLANEPESSPRLQQKTLLLGEVLAELPNLDDYTFKDISREIVLLIPEIAGIEVIKDEYRNENTVFARTRDGRKMHWQSLSDGTLKVMALAILLYHPNIFGVLCLEEPEEIVHPSKMEQITSLLSYFATDWSEPDEQNYPLRQLFVTTHSPVLVSQPKILEALYLVESLRTFGSLDTLKSTNPATITKIEKLKTRKELDNISNGDKKYGYHTLNQLRKLLATDEYDRALETVNG
jgi:predicted ATPase